MTKLELGGSFPLAGGSFPGLFLYACVLVNTQLKLQGEPHVNLQRFCLGSSLLPVLCPVYSPSLIYLDASQCREIARLPLGSLPPMLGNIWGSPQAHLSAFPSLGEHCSSFPDVRVSLETVVLYILPVVLCLFFVFSQLFQARNKSGPCQSILARSRSLILS